MKAVWKYLRFVVLSLAVIASVSGTAVAADGLKNPRISSTGVVTWDLVKFGKYPQSGKTSKEAIEWRVLSVKGNDVFLLSDKVLDNKPYCNQWGNWSKCTLRAWLNNDFMKTAFTEAEAAAIKETVNSNPDYVNGTYTNSGGPDTRDFIFCLSSIELANTSYGFIDIKETEPNSDFYYYPTFRAEGTEYAHAQGAWRPDGYSYWWIRDMGSGLQRALITYSGAKSYFSYQTDTIGVRPALHVDRSKVNLVWSGTVQAGEKLSESETEESGDGSEQEEADPPVKKGQLYTVKSLKYKITNASLKGKGTVTLTGASKMTMETLTVPAAVKIKGISFKVTAIGKNAFKNYVKLKTITVGKNVATIGVSAFTGDTALTKVILGTGLVKIDKNAFSGDKKLSAITVQSKKLVTVGENAWKGINAKAKIKVPKAKLKAYQKFFTSKTGFKKTMKVTQ